MIVEKITIENQQEINVCVSYKASVDPEENFPLKTFAFSVQYSQGLFLFTNIGYIK